MQKSKDDNSWITSLVNYFQDIDDYNKEESTQVGYRGPLQNKDQHSASADEMQYQVDIVVRQIFNLSHDIRIACIGTEEVNDLKSLSRLKERLSALKSMMTQYPELSDRISKELNRRIKLIPTEDLDKVTVHHRLLSLDLILDHLLFRAYSQQFNEKNNQLNQIFRQVVQQKPEEIKLNDLTELRNAMQQINDHIPKKLLPIDFITELKNFSHVAVDDENAQRILQDMKQQLEIAKRSISALHDRSHLAAQAKMQHTRVQTSAIQTNEATRAQLMNSNSATPIQSPVNSKTDINKIFENSDAPPVQQRSSAYYLGDKTGFKTQLINIRGEITKLIQQRDIALSNLKESEHKPYIILLEELKKQFAEQLKEVEKKFEGINSKWIKLDKSRVPDENKLFINSLIKSIKEKDIRDVRVIVDSNKASKELRSQVRVSDAQTQRNNQRND